MKKAKLRAEEYNKKLRYDKFDAITRPLFVKRRVRRLKEKNFAGKAKSTTDILKKLANDQAEIGRAWIVATGGENRMSNLTVQQSMEMAQAQFQNMSPAVREQVIKVRDAIDIYDPHSILNIGNGLLKRDNNAADHPLSKVKTSEIKEMGEKLIAMSATVKGLKTDKLPSDKMGWMARKIIDLRGGVEAVIESFRNEFMSAHSVVQNVASELDTKSIELIRSIEVLKAAYQEKIQHYHNYSILMAGIQLAMDDAKEQLQKAIDANKNGSDLRATEQVSMINERIQMLDRKYNEYNAFRSATVTTLVEYRGLGAQCYSMVDKINTAVINMIPIWKERMLAAIVRSSLDQASGGLMALRDATNEVIVSSAQQAADSGLRVQQSIEQELISAQTIKEANDAMIRLIDGTANIVREGVNNRKISNQQIEEETKRLLNGVVQGAYETIGKSKEEPALIAASLEPVIEKVDIGACKDADFVYLPGGGRKGGDGGTIF